MKKKRSDKSNFSIPSTTGIIYFEINCKLILAYAWMLIQNYFCNIFISCSISRITYEQSKHIVGTFLWRQKQIEKKTYTFTLPHIFIIPIYVYLILDRQFYQLISCVAPPKVIKINKIVDKAFKYICNYLIICQK